MGWLACGVLYAVFYSAIGALLQGSPLALHAFRLPALLVPPLAGVVGIVRRRHAWTGCQWLFWATISLGLIMSAAGMVGWTLDELLLGRETPWLGWHTVFALFGAAAPLLALLAQPHRGSREDAAVSTAVDIAGLAVVIGFLYSYFVIAQTSPVGGESPFSSIIAVSELQQFLIASGLAAAAVFARRSAWARTYRRLAAGLWVQFAALSISNVEIAQGIYRHVFVYDFVWIVPFAFYPWAAQGAPSSSETEAIGDDVSFTPSRPWLIFGALALVPLIDSGLRRTLGPGASDSVLDVSMAVTLVSTLPILMARLAVERGQARHADSRLRLMAAAIEQADELIWIVARDGRFKHTNFALRHAVGYPARAFDTLQLGQLVADESAEQGRAIDEAVRTGQAWQGTLVRRRQDGSTFPSSATVVPLTDDRGEATAVLGVERDITEELQLRQQLIHTERLSAAGQLVSGVAHEINNPLQSILGFTELLIESERRKSTRQDLERVREEAERAGKIVGNLLAFVRRTSPERAEADFNDLVRGAVAIRAYELKTRNIDLQEIYAEDVGTVVVNREEIRQILINLILNAEHAMQQVHEGGRLTIRTGTQDGAVFADVQDDGPGVAAELEGQIFEPFFTTKAVGEGTGLGLPISLGIAEAHGGSLGLVPSQRGACFRLTLPASAQAPLPGNGTVTVFRGPGNDGRRALVVDDEASVRDLLERLLTSRGFEVDVAEEGREASALIDACRYELILCDVRMPKMGGLLLYERLRAERPHLLRGFAFVTGATADEEMNGLIEPLHVPVLSKPFTIAGLDELLQHLGKAAEAVSPEP